MKWYLSHPIRGSKGKNATQKDMQKNCQKAILIGNILRNALPSQEFYIPAEHEDFVGTAWRKHYLDEKQILDVDCTIIDDCEGVIIYIPEGDELQGGRKIEYNYALMCGKQIWIFDNVEQVINYLAEYLLRV